MKLNWLFLCVLCPSASSPRNQNPSQNTSLKITPFHTLQTLRSMRENFPFIYPTPANSHPTNSAHSAPLRVINTFVYQTPANSHPTNSPHSAPLRVINTFVYQTPANSQPTNSARPAPLRVPFHFFIQNSQPTNSAHSAPLRITF